MANGNIIDKQYFIICHRESYFYPFAIANPKQNPCHRESISNFSILTFITIRFRPKLIVTITNNIDTFG